MRVLAVVHYPVYGGPHNNIVRLYGPLAELGADLEVLLPREPGNAPRWMADAGVPVAQVPLRRARATANVGSQLRFLLAVPGDVIRIARVIHRHRIDVVLLPGLVNAHGALAGRLLGRAVVWQVLDTRTPAVVTRCLMPLLNWLGDAVMFWGQGVFDAHGAPSMRIPIILASGAVDTKEFRPSKERRARLRRELEVPEGALVVGIVASWYPTKGVDSFVRAAGALAEKFPSAWFVVVGDPQPGHPRHAEEVRQLASETPQLRERLRYAPARPNLQGVYPGYDIMVVPSRPASEGLATTVLEAMSCGVPVVATDVGATSDAVIDDRTGYLVPTGNLAALTAGIERLLTMSEDARARLGREARELVVANHDVTVAANTHRAAFEAALGRRERVAANFVRRLRTAAHLATTLPSESASAVRRCCRRPQ